MCVCGFWGGQRHPLFGAMKRIRGRSKTAARTWRRLRQRVLQRKTLNTCKCCLCLSLCLSVCLACCCCSFDISTVINGKCSASPQFGLCAASASVAVFQLSAFNAHVEKIHMLSVWNGVCCVECVWVLCVVCGVCCVCVCCPLDWHTTNAAVWQNAGAPSTPAASHICNDYRTLSLQISLSLSLLSSTTVNNWREVVEAYCCL